MPRTSIELTKEELKRLPALYATDGQKEKMCQVRFFDPYSQWEWYGIEYDPEEEMFFGFVLGHVGELGYFSLKELRSIKTEFQFNRIERDIRFEPTPLCEIKKRARIGEVIE